jgi:predicted transcriptional regulator
MGRERDIQEAVEEAERDIAQGNWVQHSEVMAKLKRWAAPKSPDPRKK